MTTTLRKHERLSTYGWIHGRDVKGERRFDVTNPATGGTLAEVSDLGSEHADEAIAAAATAFASWRRVAPGERAQRLARWAERIDSNADDLSLLLCRESGKPLGEARGEIAQCAAMLRWYAQESLRLHGTTLPAHQPSQRNTTIRQPIGVVASITPWNFPAAAVIVKAGAAIASGCTTVVKPSEETPLIALALAKLSDEAELPAGVLNVVPCQDPTEVGAALCASPDVGMLSFTGSIAVGKKLYAACGDTMKRVAFELGGNAPFIVFDDADLESALSGAMNARYYNGGQICVGANRFFVHDDVYDEFARRLAERVAKLRVGDGTEPATEIGPMVNERATARLRHLVESATAMGAEVLTGGPPDDGGAGTLFFPPTVLTRMTPAMPAWETEIFGPVACLYSFSSEDEVLEKANTTRAGLAAYVYTRDLGRLVRFSESLEAGVVGANTSNIFSSDVPFGGVKESGVGRESGFQCLDEFVETKSICMAW